MSASLLEISGLTVAVAGSAPIDLVQDVSLTLAPGEVLCIVGESGSGKSVSALAALGLLAPGLTVTAGRVALDGTSLLDLPEKEHRRLRGSAMAMVFQDPMTALNPVKRVGSQLRRTIQVHQKVTRAEAWRRAIELLTLVGVPDAETRAKAYPHQWSGGMRQRAVIAMAIAHQPRVLVADEPTTALDVTVQAQIMEVLATARATTGAAMVMITHDLGLVAQVADRVAVMYSGRIVEQATVWEIFESPRHPYTQGLLGSLLTIEGIGGEARAIPGAPPAPAKRPAGCAFAPRCAHPAKSDLCLSVVPLPTAVADDPARLVACHHPLPATEAPA